MRHTAAQYIKDKAPTRTAATIKSETARMNIVASLASLTPLEAWKALSAYKPYTRNTIWARLISFLKWHPTKSADSFIEFRLSSPQLFRNSYVRKSVPTSVAEALSRLGGVSPDVKEHAVLMLNGGLRYAESLTLKDGEVLGKGRKLRRAPISRDVSPAYTGSYKRFYRELKAVGLKPHDLRKIRAADLVKRGCNVFELKALMGWASLDTANSYIQATGLEERIGELL